MKRSFSFKTLLLLLFYLYGFSLASGQENDFIIINKIVLSGNDKTKERVIFNELDVAVGDTVLVQDIPLRILYNKKRLLSTALFTDVDINIKNWNTNNHLAEWHIAFQEHWYIYPSLIFELADRNFNVWWSQQNRDFSRVNYGLRLDHINLTGNKDKLKLKYHRGFTNKYELQYTFPYLTRTTGFFTEAFYSDQKELHYQTIENIQAFERAGDERLLLKRLRASLGVRFRPNALNFHELTLTYRNKEVDPFVTETLNPFYFPEGLNSIQFFSLKYKYIYDNRIFNFYPEGGFMIFGEAEQTGLGLFGDVNISSLAIGGELHSKMGSHWIVGSRIKAKANLTRERVPFVLNQALGYDADVVRGYELYVVDGTDYILSKSSIRYGIYAQNHSLGDWMILPQLRTMNVRIFLRFNFDVGYVNEPNYAIGNPLANEWLLGYGPAVDVLLWHTYLSSFEYSFNRLGEGALFLNWKFNF